MLELSNKAEGEQIDRAKLEDLLKQKFFYDMSFSIYGGKVLFVVFVRCTHYTIKFWFMICVEKFLGVIPE